MCLCYLLSNLQNFLYNCPTIGQLITSRFKISIVALQIEGTKLARESLSTDTKLVTTTSND